VSFDISKLLQANVKFMKECKDSPANAKALKNVFLSSHVHLGALL